MKANAPEKLYISPTAFEIGEKINHILTAKSEGDIEYIRTDAFIEKACVKLKKLMYDNLMFQGRLHREEIIETFVEDFKKYMEGE